MKRQVSAKYLGEVLYITDIDKQIKEDRIARQLGKLVVFYMNKQAHWDELFDEKESGKLQKRWNSTNTQRAIQFAIVRMRNDYEKQEIIYSCRQTKARIQKALNRHPGRVNSETATEGTL